MELGTDMYLASGDKNSNALACTLNCIVDGKWIASTVRSDLSPASLGQMGCALGQRPGADSTSHWDSASGNFQDLPLSLARPSVAQVALTGSRVL